MSNITEDSSVIINICCFVQLFGQWLQFGFLLVLEVGLENFFVSLAFEDEYLGSDRIVQIIFGHRPNL